jgi:RNA polymerase I-specific transcription initiation factor RRN3
MQFARVAHATDFIYCYTILETNKRAEHMSTTTVTSPPLSSRYHRQSSSDSMMNTAGIQKNLATRVNLPVNSELNAFFPFDPYRLPKSSAFIQGVYREWSSVAIEDEDDEEEEEVEEEELDREEDGATTSSGYLSIRRDKENDVGLGESLGAMSISPR